MKTGYWMAWVILGVGPALAWGDDCKFRAERAGNADVAGIQKVAVRFTLDRGGKLIQAEVVDSSDSRLNASAVEAMKRASPFPPIPENLKELANEPLIIRFTVSIRVRG